MGLRLNKEQTLQLMAMARRESALEATRCLAYIRLFTILAVYNKRSPILSSRSGGLLMPNAFLPFMALGFYEDVFIVGFQKPTYEAIKHLELKLGWVETNSRSYCLYFSSVKYGDNRLPPIRLSFNVLLPKLIERIKQCNHVTVGLSVIKDGCPDIVEARSLAVDLLSATPVGGVNNKMRFESVL
ncbi:hypothetical protein FEF33_04120 [Moraxella osloensis]|jgi:hypothetical protein|nr:hypothetical protein FEF33_04120 [Moraxella osloensis]